MRTDSILDAASTNELIALVDSVEGKILFSLARGDRAGDQRLQSSHRYEVKALMEQLEGVLACLKSRLSSGTANVSDAATTKILAVIQASEHEFLMAG